MRKTLHFYPCIALAASPPRFDHDLEWGRNLTLSRWCQLSVFSYQRAVFSVRRRRFICAHLRNLRLVLENFLRFL